MEEDQAGKGDTEEGICIILTLRDMRFFTYNIPPSPPLDVTIVVRRLTEIRNNILQKAGAFLHKLCLPCPVLTLGRGDLCLEVVSLLL